MIGRLSSTTGILLFIFLGAIAVRPTAASDTKADEQAGAVLYRDKGCAQCHGADLAGNKKGPGLADLSDNKDWPPERITKQIKDGGQKMPPFGESLTDQEIEQIVAYLRAKDRPAPAAAAPAPQ